MRGTGGRTLATTARAACVTPDEVPGRLSAEAGETLSALAKDVPRDQIILEIGAYLGRSTCYLATGSAAGNSARIMSVDAWDLAGNTSGPHKSPDMYIAPGNFDAYLQHLNECGIRELVTPVQSFSSDAPLPTAPVGLLFIDAAHDYKGVKRDIQRFVPLVRNGVVVFDDYRTHCKGVDKAVNELRRKHPSWDWQRAVSRFMIARKGK